MPRYGIRHRLSVSRSPSPARFSRHAPRAPAWRHGDPCRAHGRIAAWALALVVAVLLALFGGVWLAARWALEAPAVAERGAQRAIASIPGLVVEGIDGSLATGLSAVRLVYETDEIRVVASDVRASWERAAALAVIRDSLAGSHTDKPRVLLASLTAARIEITGKTSTDERPTLPDSLELPVRFDIGSISVGEIVYSDPESHWRLREVEGRAASDGSRHVAELSRLVHDSGTLVGRLSVTAASPFELDGELIAHGAADEFGLSIAARVQGTLESPRLSGRLEAARGDAEGTGEFELVATPFAQLPIARLAVSTRRLNLARWDRAWPVTALTVNAEATMADERSLSGRIAALNDAPGPIDSSRVPLRQLTGRFAISPDAFTLDGAVAKTASGSELRGGGRLADGSGELRLSTPGLLLSEVDGRIKPLKVSGSAVARLNGELLRVSVDLRHRDYSLVGEATRRGSRIDVARASLASPYGTAAFSGDIDLSGTRPFRAKGDLSGFNPADFGSFPAARLSGHFVARGVLEPEPAADVELQLADSTLRGQPLAGTVNARVTGQPRFSGTLDVRYAGNRVTAAGGFGQSGDRLEWTVDAPDIARIDPRVAGVLKAAGVLSGTLSEPALAFTADARRLAVLDAQVQPDGRSRSSGEPPRTQAAAGEVHASGRIELRPQGAFDVQATARDIVVGQRQASTMQLTTAGTLDAHRLRAEAVVDGGAVAVQASGGWQRAAGWSGTLEQVSSERPAVTLAHPAPLAAAPDRVRFGPARVTVEGTHLDLQQFAWAPGELAVVGRFDDLQLGRVLKALGRDEVSTDLVLAGSADIEIGRDVRGTIQVNRQGGDLALAEEGGPDAGLRGLALSIVAPGGGEVIATVTADGERIGNVHGVVRTRFARRQGGWSIGAESPLQGQVDADLQRLSWANALIPGDFRLRGRARVRMTAGGTLGSPKLSGTIDGERLGVRSLQTGLELSDGTLTARLDGSALILDRLEAKGPSGNLVATGRITTADGGRAAGRIDVVANALRAVSRPDRVIVVSGSGTIAVDGPTVRVSGRFSADEGRIELPPAEKPQLSADVVVVRTEPLTTASTPKVSNGSTELDVEFDLGENFVLRGRGLDTRLTGKLRFGRAKGELTVEGTVRAVGGTYLAYGRRLEIERGVVNFTGALDNPTLDIRALRIRQEVEAGVLVTGPLAAPRVQLISRPDVPDTEKLSWLVLGQGLDKSNRAQGALLQSAALALLSPAGGGGLQNQIAQVFGFDQLSFTSGESLQTGVVTIGKQLTRDLYLTVEQGLMGANSFVQVNFLLGKKWTVSARSGGQENALDVYYTLRFDRLGRMATSY